MNFIRSVGEQWKKSEFAEKIASVLETEVRHLFCGATNIMAVANLIAAMSYYGLDDEFLEESLDDAHMLIILFDCFRLLVVKQIEHDKLNQAEHLIIQIAKHYASKTYVSETELGYTAELKLFQEHISALCQKLEKLQRLQRSQYRSMGRNV
ncbi:hypothetical protein EKG38_22520 [Shewanella canadensis]|uniref:Uncharacterized protein n=1 Tax=Shewanella canadensis TaxID=271096 RepID=A0A431WMD1_9GAMM|nr:hypothetical protein [Shewanella canadensis]RTR36762.1 hypothetical protein EKG38_22520 [Shewanella canadensis]